MLFGHLHWNVAPELISIGPLVVRWYGLLFATGFWLGYLWVRQQFRRESRPEASLNSLLLWIVGGAVIGARLGHCLVYEPEIYLHEPLRILKLWEGGLASHGGSLGVLLGVWMHSRRHPDQPFLWLMDQIAVPTALAGALIRLGNLFNSEILGRATTVFWAVVFERVDSVPRHPSQVYESLAYLVIFVVLWRIHRADRGRAGAGNVLGWFLVLVFSSRILLEFLKESQAAFESRLPLTLGQILSIPLVVAGFLLIIRARRIRRLAGKPTKATIARS